MDIYHDDKMQQPVLETYQKEESVLNSLKYSGERLLSEIELSSLISDLHKLMFDLFEPQLRDTDNIQILGDIEKYCIGNIKVEYKRTKDLDNIEFFVWHLSMFMTIQTFVEIVESKYSLKQREDIKNLFNELLKTDFYKFIELNSRLMKIKDISGRLPTVYKEYGCKVIVTEMSDGKVETVETQKTEEYPSHITVTKQRKLLKTRPIGSW